MRFEYCNTFVIDTFQEAKGRDLVRFTNASKSYTFINVWCVTLLAHSISLYYITTVVVCKKGPLKSKSHLVPHIIDDASGCSH